MTNVNLKKLNSMIQVFVDKSGREYHQANQIQISYWGMLKEIVYKNVLALNSHIIQVEGKTKSIDLQFKIALIPEINIVLVIITRSNSFDHPFHGVTVSRYVSEYFFITEDLSQFHNKVA